MNLTIQEALDRFLRELRVERRSHTVDVVKTGDTAQPLAGIVTTFLASQAVIEKAVALGSNLIIAHEPLFYNHLDETGWLQNNPVYQAKLRLLEEHNMVVWRSHDDWHAHQPDGIYVGVLRQLGWETYLDPKAGGPLYNIPPTTVGELALFLKARLGARAVRVVGDLALPCSRVGLMVGADNPRHAINFAQAVGPIDALICGEGGGEWETCEYMRDAITQGRKQALLLVGHAASEEPGMAYLAEWLRPLFPETPITHIPLGEPFQFL